MIKELLPLPLLPIEGGEVWDSQDKQRARLPRAVAVLFNKTRTKQHHISGMSDAMVGSKKGFIASVCKIQIKASGNTTYLFWIYGLVKNSVPTS